MCKEPEQFTARDVGSSNVCAAGGTTVGFSSVSSTVLEPIFGFSASRLGYSGVNSLLVGDVRRVSSRGSDISGARLFGSGSQGDTTRTRVMGKRVSVAARILRRCMVP